MIHRRHLLASPLALSLQAQPAPKKVAAIVTMYTNDGRLNTHANVIIVRLLDGYSPNGVFTRPRTRIVSMFTDQTPPADLSRGLAAKHGFQICNTIRDDLTLNGSDLGTLFTPPFRVTVPVLKRKANRLEIEVTNLSANRIRDLDRRKVPWRNFHDINFVNLNYKPFDASDWPLSDSGLLGPVTLCPVQPAQTR